jgi:hypothetical protein
VSYTAGETAIATRLKALGYFDTDNTDQNNWGKLDNGKNIYYAIARPGDEPAEIQFISPTVYTITWKTVIEVWYRYVDDGTTATSLFNIVNTVIPIINTTKNLGISAFQIVKATSVSTPYFRWDKDGGPAWLVQDVNVQFIEEIKTSYS